MDLSAPELDIVSAGAEDDFITSPIPAGSSFSGRSSLARDGSCATSLDGLNHVHNHRAASPPLEGDEKEFTQTASSMRMRGMSLDELNIRPSTEALHPGVETAQEMHVEETEEEKANRNREAAAALFGGQNAQEAGPGLMSSPMVKPEHLVTEIEVKRENVDVEMEMEESISILGNRGFGTSWDVREPEHIEVEDLDDLFGTF